MKTIIYLHGFGSSGQSGTVKHIRKIFPQFNVLAPDIPVEPSKALPFLKKYCEDNHADLIIGTSMGAMYAMQMHSYKRICVNPALRMSELTDILKPETFKYFLPTQSGETHFTITEDTIQQFRDMEAHLFDGVNDNNKLFCWGFFGDEDTTVNCREEFERYFGPNIKTFHGGHRMNNRIIDEVIVPIVWQLLSGYDEVRKYEGGRMDYYVAKKNRKYGILDSKGNELAPVIMDEVHEMLDTDGCIPLLKDGKWGLVHFHIYVEPIYEQMEIRSEEYVKVWLCGEQGWLDNSGRFTRDESQAYIGSWYDADK